MRLSLVKIRTTLEEETLTGAIREMEKVLRTLCLREGCYEGSSNENNKQVEASWGDTKREANPRRCDSSNS